MDQFRPAMLIELNTGLDAAGNIAAWQYNLYAAAYYQPMGPGPMQASANASADATAIYGLSNIQTTFFQSQSPLPVHNWRDNGAPVNSLARETAIDEMAELAGVDPVTFRQPLLANNPRMLVVMQAAVQKAGWTPTVGRSGRGVGLALDFGDGTYVAEVAHVSIDPSSGAAHVDHIDVAVDCGLVVNPAGARSQVEGGVIAQGLGSTLNEAITFANGRVSNATFREYAPLRMNQAPSVDVVFVEDKTQPMQGLGEPAIGPVSAAISNAIYDAIGVRLRIYPLPRPGPGRPPDDRLRLNCTIVCGPEDGPSHSKRMRNMHSTAPIAVNAISIPTTVTGPARPGFMNRSRSSVPWQ